ncbi:hypothetical protein ACH347_23905 [Saccharopolyspora sp. 5N102]|uniref:hypothetical protein n=1 Tax=Saccharopolyspora sp. 5N102 TaxID=3375155 RepID=UPI00378E4A78
MIKVLSMMHADAADEKLIAANPIRARRRGKRQRTKRQERLWATPTQVIQIADQAAALIGPWAAALIITAAWTGARWGELTGLQRHTHLNDGHITIDPDIGALHEINGHFSLGPPKTAESARTITLPPFLTDLLRHHLDTHNHPHVFVGPTLVVPIVLAAVYALLRWAEPRLPTWMTARWCGHCGHQAPRRVVLREPRPVLHPWPFFVMAQCVHMPARCAANEARCSLVTSANADRLASAHGAAAPGKPQSITCTAPSGLMSIRGLRFEVAGGEVARRLLAEHDQGLRGTHGALPRLLRRSRGELGCT